MCVAFGTLRCSRVRSRLACLPCVVSPINSSTKPPLPPCPARPAALYDGQQVPLRVRPWHGPRPQGRRAAASGAGGAGAGGLPPPAPRSRGAGGGECVWGCVCRRGEPAAWAIHFATLRCAVHASVPWTKPAHPLPACPCALLQCAAGIPPSVVARAAAGSVALLDALLACGASVCGQQQQQQSSNGAAAGATEQGWSVLENGRGSLPLLHAAWFGWEAVQRLLERGADVNERSTEGGCVCNVLRVPLWLTGRHPWTHHSLCSMSKSGAPKSGSFAHQSPHTHSLCPFRVQAPACCLQWRAAPAWRQWASSCCAGRGWTCDRQTGRGGMLWVWPSGSKMQDLACRCWPGGQGGERHLRVPGWVGWFPGPCAVRGKQIPF